ncbi:PREDICTED: uncharacterized protein LOC108614918 [Drosophila arizonae]|uniref:Uncharacterized protein LOC108614918 n=2 Tax=mojavensis species complex TaxID=198037 RepID=A0ABM1PBN8_DROAR|nr:PREDICTED: uncharacterized protein LOC108614918 [Drosophila arizonae]
MVNIAYKSIVKNSNYPRKCPLPKGLYFYRNINQRDHLIVTWDSFNCNVNRDVIGSYRCFIVDPERTLLTAEFDYGRAFPHINITLALYIGRGKSKTFRKTLILQDLYYFRNINVSEHIPPFLPALSFKAEMNFVSINIKMITVSVTGNFTRKQTNK